MHWITQKSFLQKIIKKLGGGLDVASIGDVYLALKAGFTPDNITFTAPSLSEEEVTYLIENNIFLNVDSLSQLRLYGELNESSKVGLRLNLGFSSHLGTDFSQIRDAKKIARKYNLKITSLHYHPNMLTNQHELFVEFAKIILSKAEDFTDLEVVNLGGGFSSGNWLNEEEFNFQKYGTEISKTFNEFGLERKIKLVVEPGDYLVASFGSVVSKVLSMKEINGKKYAGVDANCNILQKITLLKTDPKIQVFGGEQSEKIKYSLFGNTCHSRGILAEDITLPKLKEGTFIRIFGTGAYCYSRSNNFNEKLKPSELAVTKDGTIIKIRDQQDFRDLF